MTKEIQLKGYCKEGKHEIVIKTRDFWTGDSWVQEFITICKRCGKIEIEEEE